MAHKHRSWHFYLLVVTFSVMILGYLLWTFTPIKNEVRAIIISELQPYLGESLLINDFSIGWNSVSFYRVRAADENNTFSLDLEEIRVGVNFLKVFRNGFSPTGLIESVTVVKPHLSLYYTEDTRLKTREGVSLEKVFEEIITNIQKFPEIDSVEIQDGGMDLQMIENRRFPLLSDLDGRLKYRANSKIIDLNLEGRFLGADSSMIHLAGEVDFTKKKWLADLYLEECLINSNWPFWPFDFWQIENANLHGNVQVNSRTFSLDSLSFAGDIQVNDFSVYLYNQHITAPHFVLNLDRHSLNIAPFDCQVEDGRGTFRGVIADIFRPEADWRLDVRDVSVKYLKQSHSIFEYAYEGKMKGWGTFKGPFKNLDIEAEMHSPDLLYAVVPFNRDTVRLAYNTSTKLLNLKDIRASFFEFRTEGYGTVDFKTNLINLNLESVVEVPERYFSILNDLNQGKVTLSTTFGGNFITKKFNGNFDCQAYSQDSLLVRAVGPYSLDDQLFQYSLFNEDLRDDFQVEGIIENVFSDPYFKKMQVKDFPLRKFTRNPLIADFMIGRYNNYYLAGPYDYLSTKMNIVSQSDPRDEQLTVSTHITNVFLEDQRYKGTFQAFTFPETIEGSFDVAFSPQGVNTLLEAPNLFYGRLFMGTGPEDPFEGNVRIQHFALDSYLENSPSLQRIMKEGKIYGEMDIRGTVGDPELTFDLSAEDVIINDVGYYDTRLSGQLESHWLRFDNFWLRLNGDSILVSDVAWNVQTDSLRMVMSGENIESNFLAETIFRDPEVIQGKFSYKVVAGSTMTRPVLYGDVTVKDGNLRGNPFSAITLSFEDSLNAGGSFWELKDHVAKIRQFRYISEDDYTVEGRGYLSIDEAGPVDFRVTLAGNVLAELPKFQPFFKNPQSDGRVYAHLRGTRNEFYFQEARVKISDGSLAFENTIPPVSGLKVDAELTEASGFLKIHRLEGYVDGHWARIANEREVRVDSASLAPWVLDDMGLNFGIFTLETAVEGIPLSFYGMMEEGEYGFFATRGRRPGEKFYLTGPPDSALARGTVVLYDCRVTFPFIGMYDGDGEYAYDEDDKVIGFLMNMRWDVAARPGNNNRYFVNIPAYVGEVFMDLNIDNASPGMDFSGRLIDESFRVAGSVQSSRGRVEYLDVKFRVDRFGAEFNPFEIYPEVYGSAYTTVRSEVITELPSEVGAGTEEAVAASSTESFPLDIYLKLYVIDPITKKEVSKGRWEDFRFKLQTEEEVIGETQEDVLAHLGYSVKNLQYKAGEVGLTMTENFLIRPLFRPIERQLERRLKLDYVRLRSSITSNLFYLSFQDKAKLFNNPTFFTPNLNNNIDPALILLQSSELSLGKYLVKDVYFTYTGQVVSGYESSKLGVNHTWGLEYRLLYNLLLEMELSKFQFNPFYSNNLENDFRIRLRHSFNF